jgi:hypothetical protein
MNSLIKLVSIGSDPLDGENNEFDLHKITKSKKLRDELEELYDLKNGFYAFEMALHLFPISDREDVLTFQKWNSKSLWRKGYSELEGDTCFFAEDLFGFQFCIKDESIFLFDGETFKFDLFSNSLREWAEKILDNYNLYTGYSLAHEWQKKNGALKINQRLSPAIPFVLGGKFELGNLKAIDSVELMQVRASLYKQIKDVPDGAQVKLKVKKSGLF